MRRAFPASLIVGLLAAAALCAAPLAAAAPSSNSAVNEYTERLPEGGGGQPNGGGPSGQGEGGSATGNGGGSEGSSTANPGGEGTAGAGSGTSPLPAATARQLESQGNSGESLSSIAQETGSAADPASADAAGTAAGGSDGFLDSVGGALADFADGSNTGLGAGFPILLLVVLAGAVAILVSRSRRGADPHADA